MKPTLLAIILFAVFQLRFQELRSVTGVVTDVHNHPIPGVTVSSLNWKYKAITNEKGEFALQLPTTLKSLRATFIGYKAQIIPINWDKPMAIKLEEDTQALEEVVVVGYGTALKRDASLAVRSATPLMSIQVPAHNTESYNPVNETGFRLTQTSPVTTFSVDVDQASYANVRRFLTTGFLPPRDAVRVEEMINYFRYDYPQPKEGKPFSLSVEQTASPWNPGHRLVHIALQAKEIPVDKRPASNLVFLIDVSGSMMDYNKLPLLKQAFRMLTQQLKPSDRVSIVTYAGAAGVVLPSTSGENKTKILEALDGLEAGGSTAGGAGINLAYRIAIDNFIENGNNRVILATDGDFNVGLSSEGALQRLIEEKRKNGVFLSVAGFGMGNYKDDVVETLANKGNGNYVYIDNLLEAKKAFAQEFGATIFTVAKDVKLQVEFNPQHVKAYRLIGYENRKLENEDFANDQKDAGEMGSGHTVTAIYEVVPVGGASPYVSDGQPLKYQKTQWTGVDELLTLKVRYKQPDGQKSEEIQMPVKGDVKPFDKTSDNLRFSAAVAEFGLLLGESEFKGNASYDQVLTIARTAKGSDELGYRSEFLRLVELAAEMKRKTAVSTR